MAGPCPVLVIDILVSLDPTSSCPLVTVITAFLVTVITAQLALPTVLPTRKIVATQAELRLQPPPFPKRRGARSEQISRQAESFLLDPCAHKTRPGPTRHTSGTNSKSTTLPLPGPRPLLRRAEAPEGRRDGLQRRRREGRPRDEGLLRPPRPLVDGEKVDR